MENHKTEIRKNVSSGLLVAFFISPLQLAGYEGKTFFLGLFIALLFGVIGLLQTLEVYSKSSEE